MMSVLNLYRGLILEDTNSRALRVRVLARKLRFRNRLRVPTIAPRPAARAAGKFNSSTTISCTSCGLGFAPSFGRFGFAPPVGSGSPIEFPRRFRGRLRLRLVLCVGVCVRNYDAQAFGSASPRVGVGKWWARKKNPDQLKTIGFGEFTGASGVPRSNPPGQRTALVGEGSREKLNPKPVGRELVRHGESEGLPKFFACLRVLCSQKITVNCASVALSVSS
jgi:hypothetical protein